MKGYVEKMISEYGDMVDRRKAAKAQLVSLEKCQISENDIIESLTFRRPDGERVQTSGTSDKIARIALTYKDHQARMNEEMFRYWIGRYDYLNREITFLETSIRQLPPELAEVMDSLVIKGKTWDATAMNLCLSVSSLQRMRKQAIDHLVRVYQKRESEESKMLLS